MFSHLTCTPLLMLRTYREVQSIQTTCFPVDHSFSVLTVPFGIQKELYHNTGITRSTTTLYPARQAWRAVAAHPLVNHFHGALWRVNP